MMTPRIDPSDVEREQVFLGDRGRDLLMEMIFNHVLEMTEHLGSIGMNEVMTGAVIGTATTSAS